MNIAFRVDASAEMGTGHVMRCIALAEELRRFGGRTRFVCRQIIPSLMNRLQELGQELVILPSGNKKRVGDLERSRWLDASQEEDAADTKAALNDAAWNWLVVDHYALDARWETVLRQTAAQILVLDDLADRYHRCDALLDQNLSTAKSSRYLTLVPSACRRLEGCHYALLRPEFRKAREQYQVPSDPRLNIFFGGTDPTGMTLTALDALAEIPDRPFAVDVVIGRDNPRVEQLRRRCIELNLTLHIQPADMASLFASATLALGAGGTASWERCCVGLPTLIVSVADNQLGGAAALAQAGAAINLGPIETVNAARLSSMLLRLMKKPGLLGAMRRRAHALVDGRGTERVAIYIMRETISLLPAVYQDAEITWAWRNHPSTREFFHDASPITSGQHRIWWQKSVESPARSLLMARCGPQSVGVIRFDYLGEDAVVSIYVDPEIAGIGLGKTILNAGHRWLRTHRRDIRRQLAEILPGNQRSQRCFGTAGYLQIDDKTWIRPLGDA